MPEFSICIPYRSAGDPQRDRILNWIVDRWRAHIPQAEVCIGTDASTGPLNRSAMRNHAASKATTDILAFLDADCTLGIKQLWDAVYKAVVPGVGMVKASGVTWLSEKGTARLLKSDPYRVCNIYPTDIAYLSQSLAGLTFVMTRQAFEQAGGWDERFVGWGDEDCAFNMAVETLSGQIVRMPWKAIHLWHARHKNGQGEHNKESETFLANRALRRVYHAANGNPEAMREVVRATR